MEGVSPVLFVAIIVVGSLIALVAVFSLVISIWLAIKYVKFNRTPNSRGITGSDAARLVLDKHGCENIKVSVVGSVLFGNSYSHYFKKIRLRRRTNKKESISSLGMGVQKSALAILDKENDPDMKRRVTLIPITIFGPYAFIPILAIGVAIDFLVLDGTGIVSIIAAIIGIGFYVLSFVLSLSVLKTEKKAQERAYVILKEESLATDEEIEMMKELFHLYNIQYVNDLIIAFLEVIYKILLLVAKIQANSSSNNN